MRIIPATPMLFIRVGVEDVALGSCTLPKGAAVILSPLISHHMPELYPEPRRFRPERWESLHPSPYEYLPFGVGPRMCLGAGLAALVVRLVLALIVQRHDFSLVPGARVSRKLQGITLGAKYGLPMRIGRGNIGATRRASLRGDIHDIVDLS